MPVMADGSDLARKAFQTASELESELRILQKKLSPSAPDVVFLRDKIRQLYDDILFLDPDYASDEKQDVENAMWMKVHHKTIEIYRAKLSKFQSMYGKSKPVEYRKLLLDFTNFIKEATKYYRTLVQRLILHFEVDELDYVVKTFGSSATVPSSDPVVVPQRIRNYVKRLCHVSFVHLGDLSRYKELCTTTKEAKKNWGPSLGYYQFARKILPSVGMPMNQLAVVAIQTDNTLASTYYFLRAACAAERFPTAQDNLVLGFKKILRRERTTAVSLADLYVRIVAGMTVQDGYAELQTDRQDFLRKLKTQIKDRAISSDILSQFVNIIFALIHMSEQEDCLSLACSREVRLGRLRGFAVSIISQLLEIFSAEITHAPKKTNDLTGQITAVMRGLLPTLRLCSKWLKLNLLVARSLWTVYIQAMTLCGSKFPRASLSKLTRALSEDIDMRGFSPLDGGLDCSQLRDKSNDDHPMDEMLLRISALLADAAEIAQLVDAELSHATANNKINLSKPINASKPTTNGLTNSRAEHEYRAEKSDKPTTLPKSEYEQLDDREMPLSLGQMVDSLVEPAEEDEEELVFTGRKRAVEIFPTAPRQSDGVPWTNGLSTLPLPQQGRLWS